MDSAISRSPEERGRLFRIRHEFEDEDLDHLAERWPTVTFLHIPLAWALPLDRLFRRLKRASCLPTGVVQDNAEPVFVGSFCIRPLSWVLGCSRELKAIDADLWI